MAILKIKDRDGNFISVPTITGMPKGIYMGVTEPVDLETILWIDTSEPAEPTPVLITFSIGNVACTAEDGMTWAQWVESDYNTIEAFVGEYSDGNRIEYIDGSNGRYISEYRTPSQKFVYANETIMENYDYDNSYKYPVMPS